MEKLPKWIRAILAVVLRWVLEELEKTLRQAGVLDDGKS